MFDFYKRLRGDRLLIDLFSSLKKDINTLQEKLNNAQNTLIKDSQGIYRQASNIEEKISIVDERFSKNMVQLRSSVENETRTLLEEIEKVRDSGVLHFRTEINSIRFELANLNDLIDVRKVSNLESVPVNTKIIELDTTSEDISEVESDAKKFWSDSDNELIQDMSHYRGTDRWNNVLWFESGMFYEQMIIQFLNTFDDEYLTNIHSKTALEWGVGGGVNLRVLSHLFHRTYGVDISRNNLLETSKQLRNFGLHNYTPVHIPMTMQNVVSSNLGNSTIDFILCAAVFQHLPSQGYVGDVLFEMNKLLKLGSYAIFQTRHNNGTIDYKKENYKENFLSFTTFTTGEFSELLKNKGFEILISIMGSDLEFITDEKRQSQKNARYEYFFVRKVN